MKTETAVGIQQSRPLETVQPTVPLVTQIRVETLTAAATTEERTLSTVVRWLEAVRMTVMEEKPATLEQLRRQMERIAVCI